MASLLHEEVENHTLFYMDASDSALEKHVLELEAAFQRLEKALSRLERITEKRLPQTRDEELYLLNKDRARLGQDLFRVKEDFKILESATEKVSQKLDASLQTLRAVMEAS